eukprot:2362337-Pleurochrysis_carterae.AAC.1
MDWHCKKGLAWCRSILDSSHQVDESFLIRRERARTNLIGPAPPSPRAKRVALRVIIPTPVARACSRCACSRRRTFARFLDTENSRDQSLA